MKKQASVLNRSTDTSAFPSEEQYRYASASAARLSAAARAVGVGGTILCLLGAVAYLSAVQIKGSWLVFEWLWLGIIAAGMLPFWIVAMVLDGRARRYAKLAELAYKQLEEERKLENDRLLRLQAEAEAQSCMAEPMREVSSEVLLGREDGFFSVKKVKVGKTESLHVDVKGNPAILLSAAFAGAAAVIAAFCVGKHSKSQKKSVAKPQDVGAKPQKKKMKKSKKQ